MEIRVNGDERTVDGEARSVEALLEVLEIEQTDGLAVALNDRVVHRGDWGEATVSDGDRVEIIRATQGG